MAADAAAAELDAGTALLSGQSHVHAAQPPHIET